VDGPRVQGISKRMANGLKVLRQWVDVHYRHHVAGVDHGKQFQQFALVIFLEYFAASGLA
jgi:hypothetical protein